ncbi:MAG: LytR/AlgR family response regulator transcription factor [Syntrophothermus sp.]
MSTKISIIEDDEYLRQNIIALLTEEGYSISAASNGIEGIKVVRKNLPDLIICDIMMNGKDGYQVLSDLSKDEETKSIPFIFLTAKADKDDIRKGMNLGADDYLLKPFDADELLNAIKARLKRIEVLKSDIEIPDYDGTTKKLNFDEKLFIQVNDKTYFVNVSDIAAIIAEKQYSTVKLIDGKSYLVRKAISNWESQLPDSKFMRIHRSTIINIDYIGKMEKWTNSSFIIYIKNIDKPFIISRRYSSILREKLIK